MAVLLTPFFLQFADANGVPYAGGMVFSYAAGTVTPKNTFTDYSEAVIAPNPIILDSAGRATIWVTGSYNFVLQDSLGNTIKTTSNVTSFSVPAASANSYFQSFSGNSSTTAFTLSQDLGTDENSILVYVDAGAGNGYEPQAPSSFTLSGTTITFASAPASGTNNIYIWAPSLLLGAASSAAAAAATSETNAAASAVLASQWASQTSGIVATVDYSSKAWAIGGTGVTGAAGAAKEWATLTSATVDGVTYSAKEFAQGSQASTGGSSMNWAQQTGADVTGAASLSRSSKSWAQENLAGSTYGGSAKDWAQSGSQPDGVSKSAKSYATDAAGSATTSTSQAAIASAAAAAATAAAIGLANEWLYASSTTMADPGTGNFRLNNAALASATQIALSALTADSGNPNLRTFMQTWDASNHNPRGIIRIEKNATNFVLLGINGAKTDNTTWLQYPVTVIASAGSFTAADVTFIGFTPYGNDGTGTLNASGTPTTGSLTKWASASTVANADLSGDVTTAGSLVTTLATVNGNVGSFTAANITVDAKGRITTAANGSGQSFGYNAQASTYAPIAGDLGKLIDFTGSSNTTFTMTSAATLGAGWYCYIRNGSVANGNGNLTLASSSGTIDGVATSGYIMYAGEVRLIQSDGTNFHTIILNGGTAVFQSSGTWQKPPGYTAFAIEILSGGGAGASRTTTGNAGGGGGGGLFQLMVNTTSLVAVGSTETITVGGSAAGVTGNTNGTSGNNSSMTFNGAAITVNGAQGGLTIALSSVCQPAFSGAPSFVSTFVLVEGPAGGMWFSTATTGILAAQIPLLNAGVGGDITAANVPAAGGLSINGGGGGGGCSSTAGGIRTGGTSILAGNGGAGGLNTGGNATGGTNPSGGGGGAVQGGTSGSGAGGRITVRGIL